MPRKFLIYIICLSLTNYTFAQKRQTIDRSKQTVSQNTSNNSTSAKTMATLRDLLRITRLLRQGKALTIFTFQFHPRTQISRKMEEQNLFLSRHQSRGQ